jgi:hypothetical protein
VPRYYFNIRDKIRLEQDVEGADLPNLDDARQEAIMAAREILADRLLRGEVLGDDVFEITGDDGAVLETVPLRIALIGV